jgi:hypothetical protein
MSYPYRWKLVSSQGINLWIIGSSRRKMGQAPDSDNTDVECRKSDIENKSPFMKGRGYDKDYFSNLGWYKKKEAPILSGLPLNSGYR